MSGPTGTAVYGSRVGTTGIIFAAIAIAWLAYLVPHFARRPENELVEEPVGPAEQFADSMRIVRRGRAPLLNQDLAEIASFEVSTPMTRRAAINDLRRLEQLAASRRRRVLIVLVGVLSVTVVLAVTGLAPWWLLVVPGGLLVAFATLARFSVRAMRHGLDARYREIRQGDDESTVLIRRRETAPSGSAVAVPAAPKATPGVLWDPVPITNATYVSKPLAPRTVRTIDLSGAAVTASAPTGPVTADAPLSAPAPAVVEDEGRAASA
ncbi:hypothetical protein [uncultured Friedmanniella sp.]|uniref:hypothetical protein n=1 Tax=uncultured Friedmanniella sp. TaxID=335381 RepID=UPI0035CBD2D5